MLIYILIVFFLNIPANTQSKGYAKTFKEEEEVAVVISDK